MPPGADDPAPGLLRLCFSSQEWKQRSSRAVEASRLRCGDLQLGVLDVSGLCKEEYMRPVAITLCTFLAFGTALGATGELEAQQPSLQRIEVLRVDMAGMENREAHTWVAEIAAGAATGEHSHPTPRFVYVIEGSVIVEIHGKSPQTFKAGEGFQEMPDVVHNFRNASTTEAAKALGFQIAGKGQPLQY